MYKIILNILVICNTVCVVNANNSDIESMITYGNNLVYSGVVSYTQEFHTFDTSSGVSVPLKNIEAESGANVILNGTRTITMCFYETKLRIENEYKLFGDNHNMRDISTYNNEFSNILKEYTLPQNNNDKKNVNGTIYEENKTADIFDLRYYTAKIYGSPLEDFIAGNHESFDLAYTRYSGNDVVSGINCVRYTAVTKDSLICVSAWLAPEYYYRPVKVVLTGDSVREETEIKYIKDENSGYMLPSKINVTTYNVINNKDVIKSTQVFEINSFKPNVELADETFIIDYPEGMRVYDFRVGKWVEVVKDTENNISFDYSIEELVE